MKSVTAQMPPANGLNGIPLATNILERYKHEIG